MNHFSEENGYCHYGRTGSERGPTRERRRSRERNREERHRRDRSYGREYSRERGHRREGRYSSEREHQKVDREYQRTDREHERRDRYSTWEHQQAQYKEYSSDRHRASKYEHRDELSTRHNTENANHYRSETSSYLRDTERYSSMPTDRYPIDRVTDNHSCSVAKSYETVIQQAVSAEVCIQNAHFDWILLEDPVLNPEVPQTKIEHYTVTIKGKDPRPDSADRQEFLNSNRRPLKLKETVFDIDDCSCESNLPPSTIYCKGLGLDMTKVQVYSLFEDFGASPKSVELLTHPTTNQFQGKASIEFVDRVSPPVFEQMKQRFKGKKLDVEIFYDADKGYWTRCKRKLLEELANQQRQERRNKERISTEHRKWAPPTRSNEVGWERETAVRNNYYSNAAAEGWVDGNRFESRNAIEPASQRAHCIRLEGIRRIEFNELRDIFKIYEIKNAFLLNNCVHIELSTKAQCDQAIIHLNDTFVGGHKFCLSYVSVDRKTLNAVERLSGNTTFVAFGSAQKENESHSPNSAVEKDDSKLRSCWNFFEKSKSLFSSEEFSKITQEISKISYNPSYVVKHTTAPVPAPESPCTESPVESAIGPCSRHLSFRLAKEFFCSTGATSVQTEVDFADERKTRVSTLKTMLDAPVTSQTMFMRSKRLKLAKSSIHAMGIFAMEPIESQSFVVEYVGELVRNHIADMREKFLYEKHRNSSSYLFRIDREYVVDATVQGNLSRYMNHSCDPTCTARIINANGRKKICIYARRDIAVGQEITYDYKFPIEPIKIPCCCGAANCRGTLN